MKMIYVECNAEEMKANRTFIDALMDIVHGIVDTLNGPAPENLQGEDPENENEEDPQDDSD